MSGAKRFGGAHSPGGPPPGGAPRPGPASRFSGRKAHSFSWRVLGLYLAPTPLLLVGAWALMTADLPRALTALGPYAGLMLAAWLTREGMRAEAAYAERTIAKPPAIPRKLFGAALTGLALLVVCWFGIGLGPLVGAFYGALAAGAHVLCFGVDPMKAKGAAGVSDAELDRVAAKLDEAEAVVAATVAAANGLRDRRLEERIDRLAYAARDILKDIQNDPRDLRRARKFLSVHLVGLRDATQKYAAARRTGAAEGLEGEYLGLLSDLEQSFEKQRRTLLIDDKVDLEVEIEVLRDRLKQEGAL